MEPLRLEHFGPIRLVGLMRSHYSAQDNKALFRALSSQWNEYMTRGFEPPTRKPLFGVFGCMPDGATHFDYFCGAPSTQSLPTGFAVLELPQLRCALIDYNGHVSGLRDFVGNAFRFALPASGLSLLPAGSGAPEFIERYGEAFDGPSAEGGIEILIPVQD